MYFGDYFKTMMRQQHLQMIENSPLEQASVIQNGCDTSHLTQEPAGVDHDIIGPLH